MYDPELYVEAHSSVTEDITALLRNAKDRYEWTKNESILDVGCGPGTITMEALVPVLPDDATVVGLDISEQMVNYANRVCSNSRVSYKLQDITSDITKSRDWKPESFNKIFSFYCLQLVPNLDVVAKNLFYLMKKGGHLTTHFCITSPFYSVRQILSKQAKWKQYFKDDGNMSICSMHNAENPCALFSSFLKDAGFQEISCVAENFTYKFSNMDEFVKLCKSVTPFLKEVPENLVHDYLQSFKDVARGIKEVEVLQSGEVNVTWLNMITHARKR